MAKYQTVRLGDTGDIPKQAQLLLIAHGDLPEKNEKGNPNADGIYGPRSYAATVKFQTRMGFPPGERDGVIGDKTWGYLLGLPDKNITVTPDWPPEPKFGPMSSARRAEVFGRFQYEPKVAKTSNGDEIQIIGDWESENIRKVYISQLDGVPLYEPYGRQRCSGYLRLHKLAEPIFKMFFERVQLKGYLPLIKTYDGSYNPRFIRGSKTSLSNHAWGTAIDLNAYANGLGKAPARMGQEGCLLPLVEIANECGLYWGGHFTRKDGMHFEVAVL